MTYLGFVGRDGFEKVSDDSSDWWGSLLLLGRGLLLLGRGLLFLGRESISGLLSGAVLLLLWRLKLLGTLLVWHGFKLK